MSNEKLPRFVWPASYRSCKFENNEPILRRAENDGLIDRSINRSNPDRLPPPPPLGQNNAVTQSAISPRYTILNRLDSRWRGGWKKKMMKTHAWCTGSRRIFKDVSHRRMEKLSDFHRFVRDLYRVSVHVGGSISRRVIRYNRPSYVITVASVMPATIVSFVHDRCTVFVIACATNRRVILYEQHAIIERNNNYSRLHLWETRVGKSIRHAGSSRRINGKFGIKLSLEIAMFNSICKTDSRTGWIRYYNINYRIEFSGKESDQPSIIK